MSLLEQVTSGKIKLSHLVMIYGTDGVGKSTFAAGAPNAIFLGAEKGTANLNVARFSPTSFEQTLELLKELSSTKHNYQTLVVDSLDWFEPLVYAKTIYDANDKSITNIEDFGYGKGYVKAIELWRQFISALSNLREAKRMNVILIAHCEVKTFQDPTIQGGYDRYQLKLNAKAAALFREFVDSVLFANFEIVHKKENAKDSKFKAYGDGTRVIYTERRPGFDAKNRHGLPFRIHLNWESYEDAMEDASGEESTETLRNEIKDLLKLVTDPLVQNKVDEALKANAPVEMLNKIRNRLQTLVAS